MRRFLGRLRFMLLPTAPTHPTIAAVEAEPIKRNSELGTYTNFVNFLDLSAVAVPAAMTGTPCLPFGVTMIGPAGGDAALLELADRFHRETPPPPRRHKTYAARELRYAGTGRQHKPHRGLWRPSVRPTSQSPAHRTERKTDRRHDHRPDLPAIRAERRGHRPGRG